MSCCAIGRPSFGKRYGKNKPREPKEIVLPPVNSEPPPAMPSLTPEQIEQIAVTLLIPGLRGAGK